MLAGTQYRCWQSLQREGSLPLHTAQNLGWSVLTVARKGPLQAALQTGLCPLLTFAEESRLASYPARSDNSRCIGCQTALQEPGECKGAISNPRDTCCGGQRAQGCAGRSVASPSFLKRKNNTGSSAGARINSGSQLGPSRKCACAGQPAGAR